VFMVLNMVVFFTQPVGLRQAPLMKEEGGCRGKNQRTGGGLNIPISLGDEALGTNTGKKKKGRKKDPEKKIEKMGENKGGNATLNDIFVFYVCAGGRERKKKFRIPPGARGGGPDGRERGK